MKGARHQTLIQYIALLGVGLLCGIFTGNQIGALRESRFTAAIADCQTPEAPQVKIKPDLRDEWLKHWGVLAQHVKANEPQTLAYEVLEIEGEQDSFLVYERYCKKSDLHDPHQISEPFKAFKQWCDKVDPYIVKEGYGSYETKIGHMTR